MLHRGKINALPLEGVSCLGVVFAHGMSPRTLEYSFQ
jgi:hypothetical protein